MSGQDMDLGSLDVVSAIEQWWGADFDKALIKHMLAAPTEHLLEFFSFLLLEAVRNPLTPTSKGTLRPMVNLGAADAVLTGDDYEYLTLVPTLSVYSHEILVELPPVFYGSFRRPEALSELGHVLHRILAIKPLIQIA